MNVWDKLARYIDGVTGPIHYIVAPFNFVLNIIMIIVTVFLLPLVLFLIWLAISHDMSNFLAFLDTVHAKDNKTYELLNKTIEQTSQFIETHGAFLSTLKDHISKTISKDVTLNIDGDNIQLTTTQGQRKILDLDTPKGVGEIIRILLIDK